VIFDEPRPRIECLNHGYVELHEIMDGGLGDRRPAYIARPQNKDDGPRTEAEDLKLTRYLREHQHTTPHRVPRGDPLRQDADHGRPSVGEASINEISLRYQKATREFYIPDLNRMQRQSASMKQGSAPELVDDPARYWNIWKRACDNSFDAYEELLAGLRGEPDEGLAKELARNVLPLGTYTEWFWKCDMHNLRHFLGLRMDPHAQYEMRVYAQAIYDLLQPHLPVLLEDLAPLRGDIP
jgi:thymidylate synthase (FAD)